MSLLSSKHPVSVLLLSLCHKSLLNTHLYSLYSACTLLCVYLHNLKQLLQLLFFVNCYKKHLINGWQKKNPMTCLQVNCCFVSAVSQAARSQWKALLLLPQLWAQTPPIWGSWIWATMMQETQEWSCSWLDWRSSWTLWGMERMSGIERTAKNIFSDIYRLVFLVLCSLKIIRYLTLTTCPGTEMMTAFCHH